MAKFADMIEPLYEFKKVRRGWWKPGVYISLDICGDALRHYFPEDDPELAEFAMITRLPPNTQKPKME